MPLTTSSSTGRASAEAKGTVRAGRAGDPTGGVPEPRPAREQVARTPTQRAARPARSPSSSRRPNGSPARPARSPARTPGRGRVSPPARIRPGDLGGRRAGVRSDPGEPGCHGSGRGPHPAPAGRRGPGRGGQPDIADDDRRHDPRHRAAAAERLRIVRPAGRVREGDQRAGEAGRGDRRDRQDGRADRRSDESSRAQCGHRGRACTSARERLRRGGRRGAHPGRDQRAQRQADPRPDRRDPGASQCGGRRCAGGCRSGLNEVEKGKLLTVQLGQIRETWSFS